MKIGVCLEIILFLAGCGSKTELSTSKDRYTEYRNLSKIWLQLQKERIESVTFCQEITGYSPAWETMQRVGFCERDTNEIKSWYTVFEVPKENLSQCIRMIDRAMKDAYSAPNRPKHRVAPLEKMKIVTDKGRYIVPIVTVITNVDKSRVYGAEWESYELGEYLKKCGFPIPK